MSELSNKTQELTDALKRKSLERLKERLETEDTNNLFLAKGMIMAFMDEISKMPVEIVEAFKSSLQEVTGESDMKTIDRLDLLISVSRNMEKQFGFLAAQKDVRVANFDQLKIPSSIKVENLDEIKIPQPEKLTFPSVIEAVILKQIDVKHVEPNKTTFERDPNGRITQIVDDYNDFQVLYVFIRSPITNRVESITRTVR